MTAPTESAPTNVLVITRRLEPKPVGGRELLCKLNVGILQSIYADRLHVFELPSDKLGSVKAYANAFRGHIDGVTTPSIAAALQMIRDENVGKVFIDGSNLGAMAAALKRRFPDVEVTVFFHNCEARFFWGALRATKSARAVAVLLANLLAEHRAVRHSDKRICLSARDSRLLCKLYCRGATHVSPIALEDKLPAVDATPPVPRPDSFALFVGGSFYANRSGIEWFVHHVVPRITVPVYIVGRGFDALRAELEVPGKVTVIGRVDNLATWYQRAQFVIAPIFDGSGMKTKVAEALMFGKKVVGSPEAFAGYEEVATRVGWVCRDAAGFATAIEHAQAAVKTSFDAEMRTIFLQHYSPAAARQRFYDIMER